MKMPRQWVQTQTEKVQVVADADASDGRELVQEFSGHYDQGGAAPLDYKTWLPFAAQTYKISPDINDYVLSVTPICPADIPNRNGVGFPLAELKRFGAPPLNRMVYKAWAGVPLHREHDNEDPEKAFGVVLDASLHKISQWGGGSLWKVMGLVAVDKNKYPQIAQRVLDQDLDTYSMGAMSDYFSCSYCGTPVRYKDDKVIHCCSHLRGSEEADIVFYPLEDREGRKHVVYRNAHGLQPFELSLVEDPAWPIALGDTLLKF